MFFYYTNQKTIFEYFLICDKQKKLRNAGCKTTTYFVFIITK